jgi:HD-GYP domain-containing protein (c-di-GMP phosphodiesterase class II)
MQSLKNKLLLIFIPIVFIFLLLCALCLAWGMSNLESRKQIEKSREIIEARADNITDWFIATEEEIKNVSYLLVDELDEPTFDHFYILHLLDRKPLKYETFLFADINGNAFDSLGFKINLTDDPSFAQIISGEDDSLVSDPFSSEITGKQIIYIWNKAKDRHGTVIGAIRASVYTDYFTEVISAIHIGGKGSGWMINKSGWIISYPFGEYTTPHNAFMQDEAGRVKTDTGAYDPFLATIEARKGGVSEVVFENGVANILVYASVRNTPDWFLGVAISKTAFFEGIKEIVVIILVLFSAFGVFIAVALVLVSKHLVKPLQQLEEDIRKFGRGNLTTRTHAKGYREIYHIGTVFNDMASRTERDILQLEDVNQELKEAIEELEYTNLQLEETSRQNYNSARGMNQIISLTSSLSESVIRKDETFLRKLLDMLMELIPVANYGSISVIENEKWRFIHAIGHDIEALKTLELKTKYLFWTKEPIIVQNLMGHEHNATMPPDILAKLRKATRPIRSSIVCRLSLGEEKLGSIALDISIDNPVDFSTADLNVVRAFSNVASAFLALQKYMISQGKFQKDLLLSMIKILEIFDPYTKGHSESVAKYCARIGDALHWPQEFIGRIYWAGLVHDIGKILIPTSILRKQSPLSETEFETIKMHPVWGSEVLQTSEELEDIVTAVRYHHERWGGNGYPEGLFGEEIPLFSRVIAVADAFDAMTSDRPYRNRLTLTEAIKEIENNLGTQFDPEIGKCFIGIIRNDESTASFF